LPFARQTLVNRLAAIARLNLLPFYPGHDLRAYERHMRFPMPPRPSLSSADEQWLAEHGLGPSSDRPSALLRPASQAVTTALQNGRSA
jgi:hypothetical protein